MKNKLVFLAVSILLCFCLCACSESTHSTSAESNSSEIKAGHVYYWDGWNAFVINYEDYDIAPYRVVHIGKIADASISEYLKSADENLNINLAN